MMTPEGREKAKIKRYLDSIGSYHFWPVQTGYGAATLDCLGCYRGLFFAIEVKSKRGRYTDRQRHLITTLQNHSAEVFTGTADEVIELMNVWVFSHPSNCPLPD